MAAATVLYFMHSFQKTMNKPVIFERKALNLPNFVTVIRLFLILPVWYYSIQYTGKPDSLQSLTLVLLLIGAALLTDFLDGFLARLLNQTTNFGRLLDALSDKVVLISILLLLVLYYDYPAFILAVYFLREVASITGGMFLYFRRNLVAKPNIWGKAGIFFGGLSIFWYLPQPYLRAVHSGYSGLLAQPWWSVYAFGITIVMSVYYYGKSYGPEVFPKKS